MERWLIEQIILEVSLKKKTETHNTAHSVDVIQMEGSLEDTNTRLFYASSGTPQLPKGMTPDDHSHASGKFKTLFYFFATIWFALLAIWNGQMSNIYPVIECHSIETRTNTVYYKKITILYLLQ